jgi:predicted GNAT family N-acyltransferase
MRDPDPGVRCAHAEDPRDLAAVMALREQVFVAEQGVPPELERDGLDAAALHLVARRDDEVVGCCRLLPDDGAVRLGRMAVAASARGEGVGTALLAYAEGVARGGGARRVTLHAQVSARGFYARAGYRAEGGEFLEAGIAHVAMSRDVSKDETSK